MDVLSGGEKQRIAVSIPACLIWMIISFFLGPKYDFWDPGIRMWAET